MSNGKLYPPAPLELNTTLAEMSDKKQDINSFNNSIVNLEERITYLEIEECKSKKKYKVLSTKLKETVDFFVIIATISNSVTLAITGFGQLAIPISTGIACGLTLPHNIF